MAGLAQLRLAMMIPILLVGLIFAFFLGLIMYIFQLSFIWVIPLALLFIFIEYLIGPAIVKATTRLRYLKPGENPWLESTVSEIAQKSNIPMPKLAIVPNPTPNAFVFGRTQGDATLALHEGLLQNLNEEEIRGVVGHELGHIRHRDFLVMTALSAVPLLAYIISRGTLEAAWLGGGSRRKDSGGLAIALIAAAVVSYIIYIVSLLLVMRLSRLREHYAKWTGFVPTLALNLIGDDGEIRLDVLRTPYNVTMVKGGEARTTHFGRRMWQYVDVLRFKHPSYTNEHLHFLNLLEKNAEPQVTVDDGVELVKTLTSVTDCFQNSQACQSVDQRNSVAVLKVGGNVEETVRKSVEMLGGINGVRKDGLVVIKPNICHPKNLKDMMTTDLRVLEAVVNLAKQKTKNVVIVESDSASGTAEKKADGVGVLDLVEKLDVQFLNLSHDEVEEHEIADLPILIPKTMLKADYVINVPKLKTNSFVVLSIAMKNMFGIIASKKKSQFHKHLADVLVYLNKTVPQDLVVADGIVAMEGLGPIQGKPVDLGLIITGRNPFTVDAACCHIMDVNPYAVGPLWEAHQQGLAELDAEKIRFLGENLDSVKRKFVLPMYSRQNLVQALKTEMQIRLSK